MVTSVSFNVALQCDTYYGIMNKSCLKNEQEFSASLNNSLQAENLKKNKNTQGWVFAAFKLCCTFYDFKVLVWGTFSIVFQSRFPNITMHKIVSWRDGTINMYIIICMCVQMWPHEFELLLCMLMFMENRNKVLCSALWSQNKFAP